MAAPDATSFAVQVLVPGSSEFSDATDFLPGPDATINSAYGAGDYQVRVAGRNVTGLGEWSAPASFTV